MKCLPGNLGRCLNQPVTLAAPSQSDPSTSPQLVPQACHNQPSAAPSLSPSPLPASLPSLNTIIGLKVSTLQHVPKGARDAWASIFKDVLQDVYSAPANLDGWKKFFMLAKCILFSPASGWRYFWRDTLKSVRARIRKWREGDILGLWSEVLDEGESLGRRRKPKKESSESLLTANARRARRAMENGQYKKATQALTSSGLAQASQEVLVEMLAKHPQVDPPLIPSDPIPSPVMINEAAVVKALRSFPSGTAPGPSGLRANHLKEAVLCPSPDRANGALQALSRVINLLCSGQAPSEVIPHLCGAALFASKKKGGGLRPIAVGEVLRRLTSKCIAKAVKGEAFKVLTPLQVGVGVSVGCEAIVHAVNRVQEDPNTSPERKWTLLLDFSNAFNSIDRGKMFEEVRARIPSMAAWLECCYGAQPLLHLGEHTILSKCGVQQGDPLGPLAFALALHPIVERINREVPGLNINAWYLDDGTLCGSAEDLSAALAIVEEDGPARGLHLNRGKSLLYIPGNASSDHNPLPSDIPVNRVGFDLLGSPVGPPSFCEESMLKRVRKVQDVLDRLPDLQDSQMETTILRSCLALPKVSFALRTCPPGHIKEASSKFDNVMLEAISDLAGGPLPNWACLKASLPSSFGGLGIRRASLHAPAAYIGSLDQSRQLVARICGRVPGPSIHLAPALDAMAETVGREDWSSIADVDVPLRQRHLSKAIDQAVFVDLVSSASDSRSKALALSTAIPHAGDWLNVVPSHALGLHFHDWEFRLCLQYWLGLQMVEEGTRCPVCQAAADPYGDHQVGCGGNGDRIHRHDSLRDALFSAAQSAALAPRREVPSLIPGSSSRPADVYFPCWKRGQPAALDVSVISTLQQLTVNGASINQGHALSVGEERKLAAHAAPCRSVGVTFIPLIVESLGGWSPRAVDVIKNIGRLQGQRLGTPPADSTTHLFQRLAICLWRGNASLWVRRIPIRPSEVDGVI